MAAEKHMHFECTNQSCERSEFGFCTLHEDYEKMQDGDACPVCKIATVRRVHQDVLPEDDFSDHSTPSSAAFAIPDFTGMLTEMIAGVKKSNEEQSQRARETQEINAIATTAALLFPHLSAHFEIKDAPARNVPLTENEIQRAMRAVDLALVIRGRAQTEVIGK